MDPGPGTAEFGPVRFSKFFTNKPTHFVNFSSFPVTPSALFGLSKEVKIAQKMLPSTEGSQLELLPSQFLAMRSPYYKAFADASCIVHDKKHI